MGRDLTADKTPILANAEQNIGNSDTINPQDGTTGVVIPQTNPARLVLLSGGSGAGQSTSVIMTASRVIRGSQNPNPGFPGPITGIVEFGNGARFTRIEFDIPIGPFDGAINEATSAVEPQDGMAIIEVPTGVVRAYARYDNLLLAPLIGTNPPQSQAEVSGVPIIGPGGPLEVTNPAAPPATIIVPPEPVLAKAMVAIFGKARSRIYKTVNCYISSEVAAPQAVSIHGTPAGQVAGFTNYSFWALPAFTKSVKVLRFPDTSGLSVLLHDGIRPIDFFNIPGGLTAPVFQIVGGECIIGITSGNDQVTLLKLVCEIGI